MNGCAVADHRGGASGRFNQVRIGGPRAETFGGVHTSGGSTFGVIRTGAPFSIRIQAEPIAVSAMAPKVLSGQDGPQGQPE